MKMNYLFHSKYKKMGWFVLIPTMIIGLFTVIFDFEPDFLDCSVPAIFVHEFLGDQGLFGIVENNLLNELLGISLILSSLLVAFSKEESEDEFISKIRLESLVWATYINYGVLLFSLLFIYDLSFLWVMIFNMFTVLWIFTFRFNWQISKLKKSVSYDE